MTQFMGERSVCCLAVLLVDGVGVGSDFSGCLRYAVVLWFFRVVVCCGLAPSFALGAACDVFFFAFGSAFILLLQLPLLFSVMFFVFL